MSAGDDDLLNAFLGDDDDNLPRGFAGFTPTSVLAGATTPVPIPLNANIRIDTLKLQTAATVALCYVNDLKVGTISLNVGQQGAAADSFRYDAVGTTMKGAVWGTPPVPPLVMFNNGTGATIVVAGAIFGPVKR